MLWSGDVTHLVYAAFDAIVHDGAQISIIVFCFNIARSRLVER